MVWCLSAYDHDHATNLTKPAGTFIAFPFLKLIQVVKNSFQVVYNSGGKAYNYANHKL